MVPALCLLCGATSASAFAANERRETLVLVDRAMDVSRIERFGVDGNDLLVWPFRSAVDRAADAATKTEGSGHDNGPKRMPASDCIAILREWSAPVGGTGIYMCADGQRFPGEPRVVDDAGASVLRWQHRWLGRLDVSLDDARSIVLVPDSIVPHATESDVIALANGDLMTGLIESIGGTVTLDRFTSGSGAQGAANGSKTAGAQPGSEPVEVPIARVAAIAFVTPPAEAHGHRLWCADGTIVDASPTLDIGTGLLQIRRPARRGDAPSGTATKSPPAPSTIPILRQEEILGFVPDPARVVALASLTPAEARQSGTDPRFRVERPERVAGIWPADAAPVVVHGPAVVQYRLPAPGCSIVGEIRAAQPDPRWTDFEVVIRDAESEILRQHVGPETPPIPIHLSMRSAELSIEVTEGEGGPIRDAIEIRRCLLVLPRP